MLWNYWTLHGRGRPDAWLVRISCMLYLNGYLLGDHLRGLSVYSLLSWTVGRSEIAYCKNTTEWYKNSFRSPYNSNNQKLRSRNVSETWLSKWWIYQDSYNKRINVNILGVHWSPDKVIITNNWHAILISAQGGIQIMIAQVTYLLPWLRGRVFHPTQTSLVSLGHPSLVWSNFFMKLRLN
jgi:hypothetical protein